MSLAVSLYSPSGPQFLIIYGSLLAAALVVGILARSLLRHAPSNVSISGTHGAGGALAVHPGYLGPPSTSDPYEVAILNDGPGWATVVSILALVQSGVLAASADYPAALSCASALPLGAGVTDRAVYQQVQAGTTSAPEVCQGASSQIGQVEETLVARGLLVSAQRGRLIRIAGVAFLLVVLALGLARYVHGTTNHRPTAYLLVLIILTIILIPVLGRSPRRTREGDRLLKELRLQTAALRVAAARPGVELSGPDLVLAVALYGAQVLGQSSLGALRMSLAPTLGSSSARLLGIRTASGGSMSASGGTMWVGSNCGGSSCGSSNCGGGSSCGGGGCGGGGGGCGG